MFSTCAFDAHHKLPWMLILFFGLMLKRITYDASNTHLVRWNAFNEHVLVSKSALSDKRLFHQVWQDIDTCSTCVGLAAVSETGRLWSSPLLVVWRSLTEWRAKPGGGWLSVGRSVSITPSQVTLLFQITIISPSPEINHPILSDCSPHGTINSLPGSFSFLSTNWASCPLDTE